LCNNHGPQRVRNQCAHSGRLVLRGHCPQIRRIRDGTGLGTSAVPRRRESTSHQTLSMLPPNFQSRESGGGFILGALAVSSSYRFFGAQVHDPHQHDEPRTLRVGQEVLRTARGLPIRAILGGKLCQSSVVTVDWSLVRGHGQDDPKGDIAGHVPNLQGSAGRCGATGHQGRLYRHHQSSQSSGRGKRIEGHGCICYDERQLEERALLPGESRF